MRESKKKDTHKMTDKELLRDLFPAHIIRELKKVAAKHRKKSKIKFHRAS